MLPKKRRIMVTRVQRVGTFSNDDKQCFRLPLECKTRYKSDFCVTIARRIKENCVHIWSLSMVCSKEAVASMAGIEKVVSCMTGAQPQVDRFQCRSAVYKFA